MIILITEITLLIAALLFALCSIGTRGGAGDRCVALSALFTVALVVLIAID